jgi:predicted XRE-type DNA-binding protein
MPRLRLEKSSGNVFLDMGISRGEAVNLQIRSDMMIQLEQIIRKRGLTQSAAAKILGVTQPRVSDLVRGNIAVFSIESLIDMLDRFDVAVSFTTKQRRARRSTGSTP